MVYANVELLYWRQSLQHLQQKTAHCVYAACNERLFKYFLMMSTWSSLQPVWRWDSFKMCQPAEDEPAAAGSIRLAIALFNLLLLPISRALFLIACHLTFKRQSSDIFYCSWQNDFIMHSNSKRQRTTGFAYLMPESGTPESKLARVLDIRCAG